MLLVSEERARNFKMRRVIERILNLVLPLAGSAGRFNELHRNAWIEGQLKKVPAGLRILDAGAGERPYKRSCAHLQYTSQDFAQYDGAGNSSGLQTGKWDQSELDIVSDITAIPVSDASFDVVLCTEVLEHTVDPHKVIEELARILKPQGKLILTAPFFSLTHFAPFHYATGFNRYFYDATFKRNGLQMVECTPNGNYFECLAQEVLRLPDIAEKYSGSRMSLLAEIVRRLCLTFLTRLSKKDVGSAELLVHEYFVVGQKS